MSEKKEIIPNKQLTQTIYRQVPAEYTTDITRVQHDVPTWFFEESSIGGRLKNPCPICGREIRKQIAHGTFIEICSVIQLNGYTALPIHTDCYHKIPDLNPSKTN